MVVECNCPALSKHSFESNTLHCRKLLHRLLTFLRFFPSSSSFSVIVLFFFLPLLYIVQIAVVGMMGHMLNVNVISFIHSLRSHSHIRTVWSSNSSIFGIKFTNENQKKKLVSLPFFGHWWIGRAHNSTWLWIEVFYGRREEEETKKRSRRI